jgi:hypothetical protein
VQTSSSSCYDEYLGVLWQCSVAFCTAHQLCTTYTLRSMLSSTAFASWCHMQAWLAAATTPTAVLVARLLTGFVCSLVCKCVGENATSRHSSSSSTTADAGAAHRASAAWSVGLIIGPLLGGSLWGRTLGLTQLQRHPDALPCVAVGVLVCCLAYIRLAVWKPRHSSRHSRATDTSSSATPATHSTAAGADTEPLLLAHATSSSSTDDIEGGQQSGPVPGRYIRTHGAAKAIEKWRVTCEWRKIGRVDEVRLTHISLLTFQCYISAVAVEHRQCDQHTSLLLSLACAVEVAAVWHCAAVLCSTAQCCWLAYGSHLLRICILYDVEGAAWNISNTECCWHL